MLTKWLATKDGPDDPSPQDSSEESGSGTWTPSSGSGVARSQSIPVTGDAPAMDAHPGPQAATAVFVPMEVFRCDVCVFRLGRLACPALKGAQEVRTAAMHPEVMYKQTLNGDKLLMIGRSIYLVQGLTIIF